MNRWFADASIRRKLTALMAGTTALALTLAALGLGTYEVVTFRRTLEQKLVTVADIVGRNTTAALVFGDRSVAAETLQALAAEPSIEAGAVYDKERQLFASYTSEPGQEQPPASVGPPGTRISDWHLIVVRDVALDGDPTGTVYLRANLTELLWRVFVFGVITLLIVAGCLILALFVSAGLQRRISKPILDLANTARLVTSERNFALRAEAAGRDEVGTLVQDFNRMLAEIERQDQQLRQQQESLTEEVASRTAELTDANAKLTRAIARTERNANQIRQLTELGQLLQSSRDAEELFGVVRDALPRLFPGDSGSITILRASGNLMETMSVWGDHPPQQRVFAPHECWAYRLGRPHLVTDPASPLRCAHQSPGDGPVTFCVPMTAQGDNVGILQLIFHDVDTADEPDGSEPIQSTRARLATALAEHTALALANLRLREALRSQSIIDPLTGLYNRRYLENVLEREVRRAVRANRPLTLLMLDVDHFKQFNDTWGHDGGDAVLRELAGLLRANFRGDDVACRYGGEEFVVLLAEAGADAACERAEELRRLIEQAVAQYRGQPLGSITVSIGVASLPEHGTMPEDLLSAADRALYQAKAAGRNRTVRAAATHETTVRASEAGLA